MFRAGAARRGLLRSALPWKRPAGSLVSRGFSLEAAAAVVPSQWKFDDSVPGFKHVWDKIEAGHPKANAVEAIAEWKNAGNEVTTELVNNVLYKLCGRNWLGPANRLADWVDTQDDFQVSEADQLTRMQITSRLRSSAKKLTELSKSFQHKDEATFITFLRVYTSNQRRSSAEAIFEEFKESKLMVTARAYTLMLDMYLNMEYEAHALKTFNEYEASGLPPDATMYWLLMENREFVSSIPVEVKAKAALETLETTTENRKDMLKLHAYLGHAEEVDAIWEQMVANPPIASSESLAALASYDCLGNVAKAEEICEKYRDQYASEGAAYTHDLAMLRLYARHGKLDKALEMQEGMLADRVHFGQAHPIIDAYLKQGDLPKAVKMFHTYLSHKDRWHVPWKLVADSIVKLNKEFAVTGDVKSAEELMALAPRLKYLRAYKSLIKVYLSGKRRPAYGLRNKILAERLSLDEEAKLLLKQLATGGAAEAAAGSEAEAGSKAAAAAAAGSKAAAAAAGSEAAAPARSKAAPKTKKRAESAR